MLIDAIETLAAKRFCSRCGKAKPLGEFYRQEG
jgi:hypothetical protein